MMHPDKAPALWVVAALVAVSGFCSLVYQVVWERTVRYNFGGDSISSAIVTGTFLLGLGVGALAFGRWHRRAFAILAAVELAIGLYAIASYDLLAPLARVLSLLSGGSVFEADGIRPTLVLASVLFLLPPCILIGGTGPLIFNCFIRPGTYESSAVGWLYGVNTAGAAAGVLAVPFLFLNRVSLPFTLAVVGAGNLALGIAIWLYGRRRPGLPPAGCTEEAAWPGGDRALLLLAFLAGFISLGFEVSLFRAFFTLNPSSAYNFPMVLLPFLLSIALGSMVLTRFADYAADRSLRRIGYLFLAAAAGMLLGVVLTALLSLTGLQRLLRPHGKLGLLLLCGGLLAVPMPFFLSGVLPLLLRLGSSTGTALPRQTGRVYLANAVGAFAGGMLTQFVGFPFVGTRGVVIALFLAGIGAGAWCLMRTGSGPRAVLAAGALAPLMALIALLVPASVWETYTFGVTGPDVHQVEGMSGVAVIRWRPPGGLVYVNGQYMSALPDEPRHVQLVSFALALPRRDHVLLLGLGGGGMVRELVRDPAVKRLDVIDWSHELPLLLDSPAVRALLGGALQDPKVRLCRCDARVAVGVYEAGSFDVVIDNLAEANWVGATSVKSTAYFRQVRRILRPSGVFVYKGNYANAREPILAGLVSTFAVVREHPRGVVLCSDAPIVIDRAQAEAVLAWRAPILGIPGPPYAEWLIGGLRPISAAELHGAAPIRDDLLVHEYSLAPPPRPLPGSGPDGRP